jgi:hypothetical protein
MRMAQFSAPTGAYRQRRRYLCSRACLLLHDKTPSGRGAINADALWPLQQLRSDVTSSTPTRWHRVGRTLESASETNIQGPLVTVGAAGTGQTMRPDISSVTPGSHVKPEELGARAGPESYPR